MSNKNLRIFSIDFVTWQIDVYNECNVLADYPCHRIIENHYIVKSHWVVCKIRNDVL